MKKPKKFYRTPNEMTGKISMKTNLISNVESKDTISSLEFSRTCSTIIC